MHSSFDLIFNRSGQSYYMFGSIMIAFLLLILTCAETSLVICHFHLQRRDYQWWWKSFFSTGTNAFAFSIFSVHYLIYKTSITGALSYTLYFGYTFIIAFLFFIMTGKWGEVLPHSNVSTLNENNRNYHNISQRKGIRIILTMVCCKKDFKGCFDHSDLVMLVYSFLISHFT